MMPSRVCRSGRKWVEHAAIPGPFLKSRFAEQQKQKLSDSKVSACLSVVNAATAAEGAFVCEVEKTQHSLVFDIPASCFGTCCTHLVIHTNKTDYAGARN